MKQMKHILITITAIAVLAVIFTAGCTSVSSDSIIGTWQWEHYEAIEYDLTYQFNADGSGAEIWYLADTKTVDEENPFTWTVQDSVYIAEFTDEYKQNESFTIADDGMSIRDSLELVYYKLREIDVEPVVYQNP